jgi:hypothetical protein
MNARYCPYLGVNSGRDSIARFMTGLESGGPAMNIRYRVELNEAERAQLTSILSGGKHAVRKLKRAQILLAANAGVSDEAIASSVSVGGSCATGFSLHTKTRKLAQHGGNRNRRVARQMSGSPHRRTRGPHRPNRSVAAATQCLRCEDQMKVHHTEGARQAGTRLSRRKAKDNPAGRLPDWRATLPLAQAAPRCGQQDRAGKSMPGTDGLAA